LGLRSLIWGEPQDLESGAERLSIRWAGSTRSYSFRREALRANFDLPPLADQARCVNVLLLATRYLYPMFQQSEDLDNLIDMLTLMDDVIVNGLKDPVNWVLPETFRNSSLVKTFLNKGYPVDEIVDLLLDSIRMYMWCYKSDEAVRELIPQLLELEEAWVSLNYHLHPGEQEKSNGQRDTSVPTPGAR
jgi:cellulose biosynthesis protein BcsQ